MSAALAARMLLVGGMYAFGAWLGVHFTSTESGVAIVWPANAVVVAAFLLTRPREWPWYAATVLLAEVWIDVPTFPLAAAIAFGLVNVFEATFAATVIRRFAGPDLRFDRLQTYVVFVLAGPLVAAALAAFGGAAIYQALGTTEGGYLQQWRLWWLGDAVGLLVLTPAFVTALQGWQAWRDGRLVRSVRPGRRTLEIIGFTAVVAVAGVLAITTSAVGDWNHLFDPLLLVMVGVVAAFRFGILGATLTVLMVTSVAVAVLVSTPELAGRAGLRAVWDLQAMLAAVALVAIGLAALLAQMDGQRRRLRQQEAELRERNLELERRVAECTEALQRTARELEEANERLARLATTDHLTGLPNRRAFE